jgi:predicted Zn-dependent protease
MRRRITAVLLAVATVACATNPVTGKSELSLVSESQEISIGQGEAQKVVQSIGEYKNPAAQALVKQIGMRMAAESERPTLPWTFYLLDDETVNAFALPGGYIFITRGIMTYMNDEAELASVIGHEIGHVTAKHSVSQMSKQQLAQVGLVAGMIASPTVRDMGAQLQQGMQLLFLKFGRDDEMEADELGFRYMMKDGYDVRAAGDMFRTLDRLSSAAGQRLPEWQSTHPDPDNRVKRAEQRADSLQQAGRSMSGATLGRESYMKLLDGFVFGPDPKQGYFRNGVFYHPDLKFEVTFPAGWPTQNKPEGVMAVSSQQDAGVQLRLAGKGTSASSAAGTFFTQQGVTAGNTSNSQINGLPASSGDFKAQVDDGTVIQGTAAFIEYGEYTYMIMGYSLPDRTQNLQAIRQVTRTFKRLTDPAYLNVQAARLNSVKVPKEMTLEQFNRQFPSSISMTQLAAINGVEGPSSTLRAGQLAKQVVGGVK